MRSKLNEISAMLDEVKDELIGCINVVDGFIFVSPTEKK
jgi:hypothetical protein